ncbi:host cell division inhibitor Icd-like protein [Serratia nevei]|uniref:host cell division inhibitor Icd-like protein n=1 Tax=Serratia nevei TaxID=2703794 RepID=UPI00237EFF23|nr:MULTISPECIES: host cell division inhibitor Icd-like protein [Serratia]WMC78184.1 host cell division inhibitor Icd-like protein [Serratia nevei]WMC83615.1 host cell division inhibitor Icd-like protein [Serratia nevei]HEJ7272868.1 host cell division inhibitor Icd-like protein [Serratia marcescens]
MLATTLTKKPQICWIIAAVRRDCPTIKPVVFHIQADSERDARRSLARDHITFFMGRIIPLGVEHA